MTATPRRTQRHATERIEPGEGRAISLHGTHLVFKVDSESATGASLTEWTALPGFDTGLHVHEKIEEIWFVLSGQLEFHPSSATARNAPGRNRTCDLSLRRRTLYPLSYGRAGSA